MRMWEVRDTSSSTIRPAGDIGDWNMKRKLVITKIAEQVVTAVLENEEVVEIHVSDKDTEAYRVGNIYVGKVKNIVPNIQAAFIEIANGWSVITLSLRILPHISRRSREKAALYRG